MVRNFLSFFLSYAIIHVCMNLFAGVKTRIKQGHCVAFQPFPSIDEEMFEMGEMIPFEEPLPFEEPENLTLENF